MGGNSGVEGFCTRLHEQDTANEGIVHYTSLLRWALDWSIDVGSVAHNDTVYKIVILVLFCKQAMAAALSYQLVLLGQSEHGIQKN